MRSALITLGAVLVLSSGCGDSSTSGNGTSPGDGTVVRPGESIQAAVDAASPGDTIRVMPGDYVESHPGDAAVRVTKSLKLIAESSDGQIVRILPGPGQRQGILVEPEDFLAPDVDGIEINGFTIEGFSKMGIWLRHVQNFVIANNVSINNLENGIWPTLSAHGEVRKNISYGSLDAALWVEASENVRVIDNELYKSPTGLEVTISNEVYMEGNDVHDNVVGVGLYHPSGAGLPPEDWPSTTFHTWTLVNNRIYDNNFPNPVSSGLVAALPSGIGMLVLGVDDVEVDNNEITNNNLFGVAMVDYCIAVDGTANSCENNPPAFSDTSPDNNRFTNNVITGNAADPPEGTFAPLASDFLVLGGTNNCGSGNEVGTITGDLPGC
ncbi:MAG: right-handed parallel beta-helix repeat-containing protein [Candidatus Binatia bacterium]|nr:right-handed parallel beta-helix repeat-containing protein [Candidatus Binatia bacterium]